MKPKFRTHRFTTSTICWMMITSAALVPGLASAIDWSGTTGPFGAGSNWADGVVPSGAPANIANAGSATIADGDAFSVGVLTVGGHSGIGAVSQSGGSLSATQLIFGGDDNGGGTGQGTYSISGGSLNGVGNREMWVGSKGGIGTLVTSGGAMVTNNNWVIVGRDGGAGNVTVGGTSELKSTSQNIGISVNSPGNPSTLTVQDSGKLTSSGELYVGWLNNATNEGTLVVKDQALVTVAAGLVVGRDRATGNMTVSGSGTVNIGGFLVLGADNGAVGTMTMEGASSVNVTQMLWLGHGNSIGSLTMNSGTLTSHANLAQDNSGAGVSLRGQSATVILNGGTLVTPGFTRTAATASVVFNGGTIKANGTTNTGSFFNGFEDSDLVIESGGLSFDTNGNSLEIINALAGNGGITKSGVGTLTLFGTNSYSGTTAIDGGKLVISTDSLNSGDVTVANGAAFGVRQNSSDGVLNRNHLTLGTNAATTLDIRLSDQSGNSTVAPLNVTGDLTLNGAVTINVSALYPEIGTIPLISYVGPKKGTGTFVLGNLPSGTSGTLIDDGNGLVSLNITSLSVPYWDGTENNTWNTTAENWIDPASGLNEPYVEGDPVLFDDRAIGTGGTSVTLGSTVTPGGVTFGNSVLEYTISGSGSIAGNSGLTKTGIAPTTLETSNSYTGVTSILEGTLKIRSIANGGSPSAIGASTASPENLVITSGVLDYIGTMPGFTDRGFTLAGTGATISNQSDLTFGGQVVSLGFSTLEKTGAGNLTLTNAGANTFGYWLRVDEGTLTLKGSGTQTNAVSGDLELGSVEMSTTAIILDDATLSAGGFFMGNAPGSTSSMTLTGTAAYVGSGTVLLARGGADTTLTIGGNASFTKTGSYMSVGTSDESTGTINVEDSGILTTDGDFNIGDNGPAQGVLNISDSATVTTTGTSFIGKFDGSQGTVNQTGGTYNLTASLSIARQAGSTGVVNVSGGTMTQSNTNGTIVVGEVGTGTLNLSGQATVTAWGSRLLIANAADTASGTVNLDGGVLTVNSVAKGNGGLATFNFNGGLLKVGLSPNPDFMANLDAANVNAGGAFIDTNGASIAIGQPLLDSGGNGGLTKSGAGSLLLNGANTFTGATVVSAGILGGTGSLAGPLTVAPGSAVAPGNGIGTFTTGAATISGVYSVQLDGTASDLLAVNGALNLTGGSLSVSQLNPATASAYIIATYTGAPPAPFASVTGLPSGYALDYQYLGANQVALVRTGGSPYDAWIAGYFPGSTDQAVIGSSADPDGDGQSNALEFALGGAPNSGTNNAKVYSLTADGSADADTIRELLLTIAVRSGTPSFSAATSPSSTMDGSTYTIEGSIDLAAFATAVTPVAAVTTGLPAVPAGYEYRTFSLNGSNGLVGKGFLRVKIAY